MAKKYANVTGNMKTLSVKINPTYAFTITVKPGTSTTLTDAQVQGLINFKPAGWAVSDVTDAVVDTPAEVLALMGPLGNTNPLNHNRYTNTEAVAAMGVKANTNPLNHDRYTDGEAVAAMGVLGNANPLNHNRYTDTEAATAAKAGIFVSTEQIGTGAAQNIAHGLAGAPTKVLVSVTDDTAVDGTGGYTITEGAHDGTNVVVTVSLGVKFKVLAL